MYSDDIGTDDWSYWNRIGPQMFNGRAKVPCESESSDSCPYDWCTKIPGLNIVQFFVGFLIAFGGYPYCTALCQSIFSKALGPRPQVLNPLEASYVVMSDDRVLKTCNSFPK